MRITFFSIIMMLTGMFAFANNGNGDTNNSEPKQVNDQTVVVQPTSEEKTDDEGLYCSIKDKNGNVEASCWFCDCEKLAKAVLDSKNKTN